MTDPGWMSIVAIAILSAALATGLAAPAAEGVGTEPRLEAPVHANWTNLPLRVWAERASQLAGRPVIVDRAIDPDIPVTLHCVGEPLRQLLDRVAVSAGGGIDVLRSSIRLVPAARAGVTVRAELARDAEVARLPTVGQRRIATSAPWTWPAGSRPRDLLAAAAAKAGIPLTGLDALPHDHLPAGALPPLTLGERLDLVLADYGLRVKWTVPGRGPDAPLVGRIVSLESDLPPAAGATARRPGVTGSRPADGTAGVRPGPPTERRFTLRLRAPLDESLRAIAAQLGLELEIDRPALAAHGIMVGEIVTAQVTDATREQLLDAVLGPVGLGWRIHDGRLLVEPPAAPPVDP